MTEPTTSPSASAVGRADFLKQLAAAGATASLPGFSSGGTAKETPGASLRPMPAAPADNLVGIQMGPHTMLDEGIEHCLDLCQETASIDTLFTYCHSYGGDLHKPLAWLA